MVCAFEAGEKTKTVLISTCEAVACKPNAAIFFISHLLSWSRFAERQQIASLRAATTWKQLP